MTPAEQLATTFPPPPFILKQCKCGAAYTHDEWAKLPYVGEMSDGAGGWLQLRNCVCGSTLGIPSPADEHQRDEGDDALAEVRAERDAEWHARSW